MIDDDLGRSGGGVARPGFERSLLAICEGRVGIVLALEASRLARNGRDWHTLLEFYGLGRRSLRMVADRALRHTQKPRNFAPGTSVRNVEPADDED